MGTEQDFQEKVALESDLGHWAIGLMGWQRWSFQAEDVICQEVLWRNVWRRCLNVKEEAYTWMGSVG